jgi:hypothetical protein
MVHEQDPTRELEPHERAKLWSWVAVDVPSDFAGRVTTTWVTERATNAAIEPSARRWRRWSTAGVVALAAALAAVWFFGTFAASAMHRADTRVATTTPPPPELAKLREDVRGLLVAHCMPCHDARSEEAKPEAASVFDVHDRDWANSLTAAQVRAVQDRLSGKPLDGDEVTRVQTFVERELAWRG